jgi:hypothetical protein
VYTASRDGLTPRPVIYIIIITTVTEGWRFTNLAARMQQYTRRPAGLSRVLAVAIGSRSRLDKKIYSEVSTAILVRRSVCTSVTDSYPCPGSSNATVARTNTVRLAEFDRINKYESLLGSPIQYRQSMARLFRQLGALTKVQVGLRDDSQQELTKYLAAIGNEILASSKIAADNSAFGVNPGALRADFGNLSLSDVCAAVRVVGLVTARTLRISEDCSRVSKYLRALSKLVQMVISEVDVCSPVLSVTDCVKLFRGLTNLHAGKAYIHKDAHMLAELLLPAVEKAFVEALSNRSLPYRSNFGSLRDFATLVSGMSTFSSDSPLVRRISQLLVTAFRTTIQQHIELQNASLPVLRADELDAAAIKYPTMNECKSMLVGLKLLSTKHEEVRSLLDLCVQVFKSSLMYTARKRQLRKLTPPHADEKPTTTETAYVPYLEPLFIEMMCVSLRNKSSEHKPVRELLDLISSLLPHVTSEFSARQISSVFIGLKDCSSEDESLLKFISRLLPHIRKLKQHQPESKGESYLDEQYFANILFGMQNMSVHNNSQVCDLIAEIISQLSSTLAARRLRFTPQGLSMMYYGMQHLTVDHWQVRVLLRNINEIFRQHVSPGNPSLPTMPADGRQGARVVDHQAIGNVFYGIQRMNADYAVVGETIGLIDKMLRGHMPLLSTLPQQECANVLFSLQNQSSDLTEVRSLLVTLAAGFGSNTVLSGLSVEQIGWSIRGLCRLNSDHPEVRQLLSVIGPKFVDAMATTIVNDSEIIRRPQARAATASGLHESAYLMDELVESAPRNKPSASHLSPVNVASCLVGLGMLSSEHAEVRLMLKVATLLLRYRAQLSDRAPLAGVHVSYVLNSFKRLNSDHHEVRELLRAFRLNMLLPEKHHEPMGLYSLDMTPQQLTNAINGLRLLRSEHNEVKDLLDTLIQGLSHGRRSGDARDSFRNNMSGRNIRAARLGLQSMDPNCPEVVAMRDLIESNFNRQADDMDLFDD